MKKNSATKEKTDRTLLKKETKPPLGGNWENLGPDEKETLLCFAHMIQPVSMDNLCALSGLSIVNMMNIMERLKSRKVVYEKKGYGKGLYFTDSPDLEDFIRKFAPPELHRKVLNRLVDFYSNIDDSKESHTLLLADLYFNIGDIERGRRHIKKAADILYRTGQDEKALSYYDYLTQNCEDNLATPDEAGIYLDSIIRKISLDYYKPFMEYVVSLEKAQAVAENFKMWDRLARIKLILSQLLQMLGQHKKAEECMKNFEMLANKVADPLMMRSATLTICEYLRWKGMISEAVSRYEETVGNLEHFGDTEESLKAAAVIGFCNILAGRVSRGVGMIDSVKDKGSALNFFGAVLHAYILGALAFIDLQKYDEAELCLGNIEALPRYLFSDMTVSVIKEMECSILAHRGEYEKAFAVQQECVALRQKSGWLQDAATLNFERLRLLESKGLFCQDWNLDSDIAKYIALDNAYMKGAAFRYKALKDIEQGKSSRTIMTDLKNSERHLKNSGAMLELARTWIMLGDLHFKQGDPETGLPYLEDAWNVFSKIDKNLFPKEFVSLLPSERRLEVVADRLIEASESLGMLQHHASFPEKVLNAAMDFTGAIQGSLTAFDGGKELYPLAIRNIDLTFFDTPRGRLMRTLLLEGGRKGTEIVLPQTSGDNYKDMENSLANVGITALICMPVRLHQRIHSFLLLANRLDGTPFPDSYLPYVRLFCNQIALGLANIEMYREVQEQKDRLEEEAGFYKREMGIADDSQGRIIGKSEGIERVLEQIRQVAPTTSSVLIQGETGVGKELVAKAIHNLSRRKDGPFIPVNLSSLPQELVASELFGHEKGAFTGAHNRQKGRFELAHGGTIFLDEIGDLPMAIQVKLLRVLQEGSFERLGSARPIGSDFRVIAATNKNLALEVEKGNFRQDLYYRLNVFPIHVPALRDRKEDILLLAQSFIEKTSRKLGKKIQTIPDEEMRKLLNYHWPGNVRELEHFIERAVILSDGYRLNLPDFGGTVGGNAQEKAPIVTMEEMEREHILRVLGAVGWRVRGQQGAAHLLGLKPTTLYFRMRKFGIERPADHVI